MMEERKQNEKLVKVEMIELTEEEKECMKLLDEKLAGGAGAILWCACVNQQISKLKMHLFLREIPVCYMYFPKCSCNTKN